MDRHKSIRKYNLSLSVYIIDGVGWDNDEDNGSVVDKRAIIKQGYRRLQLYQSETLFMGLAVLFLIISNCGHSVIIGGKELLFAFDFHLKKLNPIYFNREIDLNI